MYIFYRVYIICLYFQGIRPTMSDRWSRCPQALSPLSKLMAECWHSNPSARLPALRVKKTLASLMTGLAAEEDMSDDLKNEEDELSIKFA
jgi:hypothetical protein